MPEESSRSIPVKEVRVEFGLSFLSDYWNNQDDLPLESRTTTIASIFNRTWIALRSAPLTTLSSYIIVSASLLVLTLFLLFDHNIERLLDQVGASNEGVLYFNKYATPAQMSEVQEELKNSTLVSQVNFISKDKALELFKEDLGGSVALLKGLEDNPLPNAIEFQMNSEFNVQEAFSSLSSKINSYEVVEEISLGAPWADAAETFREGVKKMSLTILLIVLAVVMFIVANVVKLMLFSQKEEIEIMQLVGAPRDRVMLPYLITGFLQGFAGGVSALVLCYVLFTTFMEPLNSYLVLGVSYEAFSFLSYFYISLVILTGVLLGVGGSILALKRWVE